MDHEIFISYRHDDVDQYTITNLAKDIGSVFATFHDGPGRLTGRWDGELMDRLERAPLVLVVVGPKWLDDPRLREPDDVLRREVEYALQHEIALPVYFRRPLATSADFVDLPELEGLCDWQGVALEQPPVGMSALLQQIARRLQVNAFRGRPAVAEQAPRPRPRAGTPPAPEADDVVVGVLGGGTASPEVVLRPEELSLRIRGGTTLSSVEVPGARGAALTSDGTWTVVEGAAGLTLVDTAPRRLRGARALAVDGAGPVVGAWREGDMVVAARAATDGTGLVRLDPSSGRVRPWGGPPAEAAGWRRAAGHAGGWVAIGAEGRLSGDGDLLSRLQGDAKDWIDVDLMTTRTVTRPRAVLAALRKEASGTFVLVVSRMNAGLWWEPERYVVDPATRVHVGRPLGPGDEPMIFLGGDGEVEGWTLHQLRDGPHA